MKVALKNIIVLPDRARKAYTRLQELAESLKKNGFIHPVCVTPAPDQPGKYILIAGGRRFRAATLAGLVEIPVTLREEMKPLQMKVLELEENVGREGLDWQEEAELHRQIDELKRSEDPSWQQQQTAQLVGLGPAMISRQIKIAKELKANPELVKVVGKLDFNSADKVIKQYHEIKKVERLESQGQLKVSQELRLGDCRDLIRALPDASVDLWLSDPPYGLEQLEVLRDGDGSYQQGMALMSEHHNQDIERVLKLLRELAPQLHRVLKPSAHFYCFTAFQYAGDFIKALAPLEFQPPMLIWKRERNTTAAFGYNYMSCAECIIYGHNPPRGKRLNKNIGNILEFPEVPKSLRVYPTQKPVPLLKALIAQSTIKGDLVLDTFGGSGSTLEAAKELGRRGLAFEIDKDAWSRAQLRLSETGGTQSLFERAS